jgi:hypothetical protein
VHQSCGAASKPTSEVARPYPRLGEVLEQCGSHSSLSVELENEIGQRSQSGKVIDLMGTRPRCARTMCNSKRSVLGTLF